MQRPLISRLHPGRHAGRVERVMPHEVRQQGQQFGVAGDAASHGQQGGVAGQRVAQLIGADPGPVFQEGLHLFVRKAVLVVQDGQEDQAAQDVFGQGLLRLTAGIAFLNASVSRSMRWMMRMLVRPAASAVATIGSRSGQAGDKPNPQASAGVGRRLISASRHFSRTARHSLPWLVLSSSSL